jgi:peptidoglycan/LPS O-acetylase OafA/YrhL
LHRNSVGADIVPHSVTSHIPELDGIRGIAILLVLIGHGWYHRFTLLAVSGVDLFFVLSGFLITRILIGSISKPHYFSNFYIRRAFRIWPLYFVILCITYLTHIFSFSRQEFPAYRFVLYIQNFWSLAGTPPILAATWSLAIEEQFYLVWPVIVWLCSVPRRVGWISVILIVAMPASRVLYHLHGLDPYMLTFGRLDGLAAGAGLAVLTIGWSFDRDRKLKLIAVCLIVAILLLPLSHFALLRKAFKDTSMNLFWLVLLAFSFYWRGSSATRILRSAPLRFFGKISYCAYLVHMALLSGLDALPIVARLSIAVLVATASWYLFERPILQIKERFTRPGAISSKPNPVTSKIAIGV